MPRKGVNVERDLITVSIRQKDYNRLRELRRANEPFYSNFRRVLDYYFSDKAELDYALQIQTEATQNWMKRALIAEEKSKHVQETLI